MTPSTACVRKGMLPLALGLLLSPSLVFSDQPDDGGVERTRLVPDLTVLATPPPPDFSAGITDRRSVRETPVTLPPAGSSFIDPDFKTKIVRLTDAAALGTGSCVHSYSMVPAMNVDSTRILVSCGQPRLYRFDPITDRPTYEGTLAAGQPVRLNWESAYWSSLYPNVLYVLGGATGARLTKLYSVDVTRTDAGRFTLIRDFAGSWSGTWDLWQLSVSSDDNVFTFHARDTSGNTYRTAAYIRSQNRLVTFPDTAFDANESYVAKHGRIVMLTGQGANAFTIKMWDPWTNAVVTTLNNTYGDKTGGHYDLGASLMVNGDRWDTGSAMRTWDALHSPRNIFQYKRADGSLNWTIAAHTSLRNANESFVVISTYGAIDSAWPAFQHEIILVKTDGSGFSRMAHTRSRATADSYWSQPRAVVDRLGRYVVFTSDNGTPRNDVYILKLPQSTNPSPSPTPHPPDFSAGITDRRSVRETPVTLPPAGSSFIDPDFRTKIIRLTDAAALGVGSCVHSYSMVPAMNVDSTRILVSCGQPRLYRFEPITDRPTYDNTLVAGQPVRVNWESAYWSALSPNILYVLGGATGARHTKLYSVDVTRTDAGRFTVIRDFAGAWPGTWDLWQLSVSSDDNVFTFHARDTSGNTYRTAAYIRSLNRLVTFPDTAFDVNESYVAKHGRTIMVNGQRANSFTNKMWDPWTNTVVTTLNNTYGDKTGGHYDLGTSLMINGDRWDTGAAMRTWNALHSPRNIFQYKRADGSLNWTIADHTSLRNANESFVVLSTYGAIDSAWPAFQHEIILVKTDGTGFSRMAHTRSRATADSYWSQPRAVVDRLGRYVVFTSDNGTPRNDVYLLKLPHTAPIDLIFNDGFDPALFTWATWGGTD